MVKACGIPTDDVARYLGNQGTLDSMVEVGLDGEVRSGLGVQPELVPRDKTKKMRSLMFSYQENGVLEREVNDEALAIMRQKDEQAKVEGAAASSRGAEQIEKEKQALQAEIDELQSRSKTEIKVANKDSALCSNGTIGGRTRSKEDNKEVLDYLQSEWDKTAKNAADLIN